MSALPQPAVGRVGVYEIGSPLGVGGMGEVYRARDTRLDRQVAIKFLLDSVAHDPDRLARFEREAKLLASLNHPHIAHIYGLEDSGPKPALVMELVEGPTLADRIAQGALPIDEALSVARQLAAALEAAHDQGVIHRDLKPANIKLRADGTVKVLDFGLAKLADPGAVASGASALTSPAMTRAGLVVGTPAYMSPEQARGQAVDTRTDLWALGCVCYEMLTGRRAFEGETASDAISAVLTRDPDWSALPDKTPVAFRRLLRRCLSRDAARRLRHAGDVRLELDELTASATSSDEIPARPARASRLAYLPWAITAVALSIPKPASICSSAQSRIRVKRRRSCKRRRTRRARGCRLTAAGSFMCRTTRRGTRSTFVPFKAPIVAGKFRAAVARSRSGIQTVARSSTASANA